MLKKIVWSITVCSTVFISNSYGEDFETPSSSKSVQRAPTATSSSSTPTTAPSSSTSNNSIVNMTNVKINNNVNNKDGKMVDSNNGINIRAKKVNMRNVKIKNKIDNRRSTIIRSNNGISIGS